MDVFVSWTEADKDVKNALVDRLRKENITCWVSDEQCNSAFGKECPKGIENCGVFIVLVSDATMSRGFVRNEVIIARELEDKGQLNILVYKITDAEYTGEFKLYLNHISFVTGNFFQRKESLSGDALDQIVQRTKELLRRRAEGDPERPFDVHIPEVEGTKINRTGYFVPDSRADALAELEAALSGSNVAVLNGLFGYGKRTVVRRFAQLHKEEFASRIMVSSSHNRLRDFILDGLTFSNVNPKRFENLSGDRLIDEKLKLLEKLDKKTLLVITGIREEQQVDPLICERLLGMKCRIILVTEGSADHYRDWFPVIRLGRMTNEQLTDLFFHDYPYADDGEKQMLAKPLEDFFDRIGGHTQAVELTARALASDELRIPPEEIGQYLSAHGDESAQLQDRIMEQLSYVLDIEQLTEEEIVALLAAAHIAVPYISEKQYRSVLKECGVNPRFASLRLEKRRWLQVDMYNKSISIEPLIARIVQNKYAEDYFVLTKCLDYLLENSTKLVQWGVTKHPSLGFFRKLANLLSNARMPEAAMVVEMLLQYQIDEQGFDYDRLADVIAAYEKKYVHVSDDRTAVDTQDSLELSRIANLCKSFLMDPNPERAQLDQFISMLGGEFGLDGDAYTEDEDDEDWDFAEEFDEDFYDGAYEEEVYDSDALFYDDDLQEGSSPEVYDRKNFEKRVRDLIDGGLLYQLKLISSNVADLLTNFSPENSMFFADRLPAASDFGFSPQELFGLSDEEINIIRFCAKYLPAVAEDFEDLGEEMLVFLDTAAAIEALYKKDYGSLMISLNSALVNLAKNPDVLENDFTAMLLYLAAAMVAAGYNRSGAPRQAIVLCEKILQYETDFHSNWKNFLLVQYINAHRSCRQFTDSLFNAYETVLEYAEESRSETFDSRIEFLGAQKALMLLYAKDLALGGRSRAAREQFAAAQKLAGEAQPDEVIYALNSIVETLIKSGDLDQAADFMKQNLDPDTIRFLQQNCSPEALSTLEECIILMEFSESAEKGGPGEEDPREYISYYQEFFRKNNTLLEKKYYAIADRAMQFDFSHLTDEEITQRTAVLRCRARTEKKHRLAPEAFALVSEAGLRVLGYKHHYVQYMGAAAMADGKIAEILNGEGKTYTIVLVAYLNALYGQKVCVVDSSEHLSRRNHAWMHGVYDLLGISHELLESEQDVAGKMENRQADVSYASLSSLVFGYLRQEMDAGFKRSWFRLDSVIIDEADMVLVDNAKMVYRFIDYNTSSVDPEPYQTALYLSRDIGFDDSFYTYEKRRIQLQPGIYPLIEDRYGVSYERIQDLEKIRKIEKIVASAILCRWHMKLNADYFIHKGVAVQENKNTGTFEPIGMPDQYFLCAVNGLDIGRALRSAEETIKLINSICLRNFLRQFRSICGTTATAASFCDEFREIYGLDYVAVPPHRRCSRANNNAPFYGSLRSKELAILEMVAEKHRNHQPVLVATQSIQESERFSHYLQKMGISHALLNARNPDDSSDLIALAGMPDFVLVATALVNRGTDIKLGGDPELRTRWELVEQGVDVTDLDDLIYGLPKQKQQQSELYQKFRSILEKNRALAATDRQKVIDAGGLCVIGTSFFPELRTEQQTRGRSGRQGEIGESWAFFSIEDESMDDLITETQRTWFRSLGVDDVTVEAKSIYRVLENAQKVLHAKNFSHIRRVNETSRYIDEARKEFIGRKEALADQEITPDDIFWEWTGHPKVQQWLSMLQAGETPADAGALPLLYSRTPRLRKAKGNQARRILFEAVKAETTENEEKKYAVPRVLSRGYADTWTRYVNIAFRITADSEMKEKAALRILRDEKEKLLLEVVDRALCIRVVHWPRGQ